MLVVVPQPKEFFMLIHVNNRLGHEATLAIFDKVLADETIA